MRISLFGNLHINVAGRTLTTVNTNRLQSLLAYLLLHPEAPQPRDALAFTLWPASRESQARTNLRQLLHNLKRALSSQCDALVTDHAIVHWRRDASCDVDVWEFQSAVAEAGNARSGNDRAGEIELLKGAAALYTDDLLPGLYDDWLSPFRHEYRRRACDVLHRLATTLEQLGHCNTAIAYAERLLTLDPLAEAHYQLLMRLHAGNDDRASALHIYHKCMRVLRREMGVEPGTATRQLFESILKEHKSAPGDLNAGFARAPAAGALSDAQRRGTILGRKEEWNRLALAWETAVVDGPRVALIFGEAGIGKTRLADELCHWCTRSGHSVARGRCYAGAGQASYSPVTELLRSESVRSSWTQLRGQQLADLARLVPEAAPESLASEALSVGVLGALPENWQRIRLYGALNAAIGRSRKPLLLYIDDMQWCDPDTLEWLGAFLQSPDSTAVLVIGTVRPEETDREHPFNRFLDGLRRSDLVSELLLQPLSAQETAELAQRESSQPLETGRVAEIVRATRGNPLFVLESVRAGLQSPRVQAVISSRLARLTPAAYELVALASVIGRPFSLELLRVALDWDETTVTDALDELWRRRIVESCGTSDYDFTHDLLREAACSELSPVRRRYLHQHIALALAEVHREDVENWNGQIAYHFERAGAAELAIDWFRRAAAHARQRYADSEAAAMLRHALALCKSLPESNKSLQHELCVLVMLGPVLVTTEGYSSAEVGSVYERALELSRHFDDRNIFVILSGAWFFNVVRGNLDAARQVSLEFLMRAEREPTPHRLLAGNFLVGSSMFHMGELRASLHHMNQALHMAGGPVDSALELFAGPDLEVFCHAYLAHLTWHCGEEEQSVSHAGEAIALAKRLRHPFGEAIALNYSAMLRAFRRDSRGASEHAIEAIQICKQYGFAYYLAMASVLFGWAEAAEGNVSAGLGEIRNALSQMRELGAELRVPFYMKLLAETLARAGHVREALADLSTAFAIAGRNGEGWALAELHRTHAELLLADGQRDQARISFQKALDAARQSGSLAFEQSISRLLDGTAADLTAERLANAVSAKV